MSKRSSVALDTVIKQAIKVCRYPWMAGRLAAVEKEKIFFSALNPRAETGHARSIRQLSIRITDLCNLRCHTCGQWGDHGFLHGQNLKELKKQEVTPERYMTLLEDLARNVKIGSLCGLGKTAPNPVLSTLRWFRDEYEAHIYERHCPAAALQTDGIGGCRARGGIR